MAIGFWETSDHVDQDVSSGLGGNFIGMKWGSLGLSAGLCAGASFTGLNVSLDVLPDFWPPIIPKDEFFGLFYSRMSCGDMIMAARDDFSLHCIVTGHIYSFIVVEKAVLFLDAFLMVERLGDSLIPFLVLVGRALDALMGFIDGGHD